MKWFTQQSTYSNLLYIERNPQVFSSSPFHTQQATWRWWYLSVAVSQEDEDLTVASHLFLIAWLISYLSKHGIRLCSFASSQICRVTSTLLNISSLVLSILTFILQCGIPDCFCVVYGFPQCVISWWVLTSPCWGRRKIHQGSPVGGGELPPALLLVYISMIIILHSGENRIFFSIKNSVDCYSISNSNSLFPSQINSSYRSCCDESTLVFIQLVLVLYYSIIWSFELEESVQVS